MTSPFIPAEWGKEYDLAGAVWKPDAELVTSRLVTIDTTTDLTHDELRLRYQEMGAAWQFHTRPVLPSPDWINAQRNPRAVAIAALERAGFEFGNAEPIRGIDGTWLYIGLASDAGLYVVWERLGTRKPVVPASVSCELEQVDDPALARYAVDCLTRLHEWAGKVNWDTEEAKDE